jgi:hypothetical protein
VSLKSSLISSISSTTEKVLVENTGAGRFAYCRRERKLLLGARCIDLAYALPLDELRTVEPEAKRYCTSILQGMRTRTFTPFARSMAQISDIAYCALATAMPYPTT